MASRGDARRSSAVVTTTGEIGVPLPPSQQARADRTPGHGNIVKRRRPHSHRRLVGGLPDSGRPGTQIPCGKGNRRLLPHCVGPDRVESAILLSFCRRQRLLPPLGGPHNWNRPADYNSPNPFVGGRQHPGQESASRLHNRMPWGNGYANENTLRTKLFSQNITFKFSPSNLFR